MTAAAEGFQVGDAVARQDQRDYTFVGVVVARFFKRNGTAVRYVVEDDRGVLLVFSMRDLRHHRN